MPDCIFCKIIEGALPSHTVYEDDGVKAFLDINPINPGHVLIVPKRHSTDMLAAPEEDIVRCVQTIRRIAPGVMKAVGAEAFNLGLNNGTYAGQIVPHVHFHLMPRFPGDGRHLWSPIPTTQEELKNIGDKIRTAL